MIGKHITVNFEGTILSYQPIQLDKDYYRLIDEAKDIEYLPSKSITLNQYTHKMTKNLISNKTR